MLLVSTFLKNKLLWAHLYIPCALLTCLSQYPSLCVVIFHFKLSASPYVLACEIPEYQGPLYVFPGKHGGGTV